MKTIDDIQIPPYNMRQHVDIEKEMLRAKKSWYHFELRFSGGKIVDFVIREYSTYENVK